MFEIHPTLFVLADSRLVSLAGGLLEFDNEKRSGDATVTRIWLPEVTQEGQWCHLALLFHRAGIYKNSTVSLYANKELVKTEKVAVKSQFYYNAYRNTMPTDCILLCQLAYISPNVGGGGTSSAAAVTSTYAYIGTPPQLRRPSALVWRQGPCHLFEDVLSTASLTQIFDLGPNYVGSFQGYGQLSCHCYYMYLPVFTVINKGFSWDHFCCRRQ